MVLSYDYANECPSSVDHLDGHDEALKRYMRHRPMLLAPYRLGGRQGNSKQNNNVSCTLFDGHFGGHRNVAVLYHVHCPMEVVQGFHISH